jgi:carbon-monoxide dehydrogenase small subunit
MMLEALRLSRRSDFRPRLRLGWRPLSNRSAIQFTVSRNLLTKLGVTLPNYPTGQHNGPRLGATEGPQRLENPAHITRGDIMASLVSLHVNGEAVSRDVEPETLLVTFLREQLRLTGTHVGCDTAQCGACTVHLNGRAVKSCNVLAVQANGSEITTIEGLTQPDGSMHPMQAAFRQCHGLQCGFCTPGMVMSSIDLVLHHPHGNDREIRESLEGNFCRCTGYQNIVQAIATGARAMGV